MKMSDFFIGFIGKLIQRQETLFSIKGKMSIVIVGKVPCIITITDHEQLNKTKERFSIPVAWGIFVIHNLLHSSAWANGEIF